MSALCSICGAHVHVGRCGIERKDTNPKDAAATSRLDLSLVPSSAIAYCALALTEGHLKYGGFNWRDAGVQASVYLAACQRHLAKWTNGEEVDPHTHVSHLANAIACIAILIDAHECGKLNDDRPPRQDVGRVLEECKVVVEHLQSLYPEGPARHREKK